MGGNMKLGNNVIAMLKSEIKCLFSQLNLVAAVIAAKKVVQLFVVAAAISVDSFFSFEQHCKQKARNYFI